MTTVNLTQSTVTSAAGAVNAAPATVATAAPVLTKTTEAAQAAIGAANAAGTVTPTTTATTSAAAGAAQATVTPAAAANVAAPAAATSTTAATAASTEPAAAESFATTVSNKWNQFTTDAQKAYNTAIKSQVVTEVKDTVTLYAPVTMATLSAVYATKCFVRLCSNSNTKLKDFVKTTLAAAAAAGSCYLAPEEHEFLDRKTVVIATLGASLGTALWIAIDVNGKCAALLNKLRPNKASADVNKAKAA